MNNIAQKLCGLTFLFALLMISGGSSLAASEPLWMRYPAISPDDKTIVFGYQGDLFKVDSKGGTAVQLTRHPARDFRPVWSKDGQSIAFASDRYGNFDIFLIPAEGGEAKRLTFHSAHDYPTDFCPQGRVVFFYSARMDSQESSLFPHRNLPELYCVPITGERPAQVLTTPALDARLNRLGNKILYHNLKGFEVEWRKHQCSAAAGNIWLYDMKTGIHTQLTTFDGEDRNPVWAPDEGEIYFLSEKSGSFNIWKASLHQPERLEQVSFHLEHPVRFLTISDHGDLCYGYNGEIYVQHLDSKKPFRVPIQICIDAAYNPTEFKTCTEGATEMALSPNGKELAFIIRGEIFVTAVDYPVTKRITTTPEQERWVSFSADGRTLLFAGERDGSWNLYQAKILSDDEPYFYNSTLMELIPLLKTENDTFQPAYSPDGKEVAFLEERTCLKVINLETKQVRIILPGDHNFSYMDGDQWFCWSPDGRWFLVEFFDRERYRSEAGLVMASEGKEVINLTNSGYDDLRPQWMMKGKMMIWQTNRNSMRSHSIWGTQSDVYGMFFTKKAFDRFQLSEAELEAVKEREKEEKHDESEEEKEKETKQVEPVNIGLTDIEGRVVRLTSHSSQLADAVMTPDGETLVYLSWIEEGYDLWIQQVRKKSTRLLTKLYVPWGMSTLGLLGETLSTKKKLILDKTGQNAFVLCGGMILKVNLNTGEQKPLSFIAEMRLNREKEREYLFEHLWRLVLKKFYKKDLHGVDWNFYKQAYARFLPHINNNWDFAEMVSEMMGELNASHCGVIFEEHHQQNKDSTSALGAFFDPQYRGDGLRILEVLKNGPLDKGDSMIEVGTVIKKINGILIRQGMNYYPLLDRQTGKSLHLTLFDPKTQKEWTGSVKPVNWEQQNELLYQRWVKTRRLETDRLSNGRLGYVHIRGMNYESFIHAYSEILGRYNDKKGVIVDTRFNGGGNLHDQLVTLLAGKRYWSFVSRGQVIGHDPQEKWQQKSVVLMSERNYSNAHMFPYIYRRMGLGKLVGMAVPGTGTGAILGPLQDSSLFFGIPTFGFVGLDGKYLENQQLEPDIKVDNDPESTAKGRDKQLEKAVEVLLDDEKP